jgi:hypothetical protein
MRRFLTSFSYSLLFCAFARSQVSTSISTGPDGMHGTIRFYPLVSRGSAIAGAPYSAEKVNEDAQTLADGTHISRTVPEMKFYRDSMGRTREERPAFRGPMNRRGNGLSKSDDPRRGEHTRKLVNMNRTEPDASLFEVPPGYTVKDEKKEFSINWNSR